MTETSSSSKPDLNALLDAAQKATADRVSTAGEEDTARRLAVNAANREIAAWREYNKAVAAVIPDHIKREMERWPK